MKVYWKSNPAQIGVITRVYVTSSGQKRMEVSFPYSIVDADVLNFEMV